MGRLVGFVIAIVLVPVVSSAADKMTRETFGSGGRTRTYYLLMPPVGSVLNDDQIAGVLTYIHREWGQTGTAVDPGQVKAVRTQTATRTMPWTHDELMAMVKGVQ